VSRVVVIRHRSKLSLPGSLLRRPAADIAASVIDPPGRDRHRLPGHGPCRAIAYRSRMSRIAFAFLAAALAACTREAPPAPAVTPAPSRSPVPGDYAVERWHLPVTGAAQPDLVVAPDGSLLLSWIEKRGARHALRFARHDARGWSTARTIATGDDWFVNWADTPHIAATPDGALWAHWLRKSAAATYAYDVVLSRSGDGGATWASPVRVNDDGTPTEHGFVSLWPATRDSIGIAWLDGREMAGGGASHSAHAGHGAGGAMTLRSATFDASLERRGESRLDASTCDCCQTDVVIAGRTPVLVYRDRAPGEIRDIVATRFTGAGWTAPRVVHADRWHMPACPVNGPAAAAQGALLAVGWYTMAGEVARVQIARSRDAGATFAQALVVDRGPAVLGRVAVAQHAGAPWIAWLREEAGRQSLWLAGIDEDGARVRQRVRVAELQGRGRGTGVPQLVATGDALHLVWTDVVDGMPRLRGARIVRR
jgi:hypothetical protein